MRYQFKCYLTGIGFVSLFIIAAFTTAYAGWHTVMKRVWEAYSLFLIPVGLLPWALNTTGILSAVIGVALSSFFCYMAFLFYREQDDRSAKQLMFTTFFYLPLLQIVFVLDRVPIV